VRKLKNTSVSCPICEKRTPGRFCPAKGEKICAVCCGTGREVTIDCPADCAYLLSAHRYEDEHPRPVPADTPLLDIRFSLDIVHAYQRLLAGLAFAVAKVAAGQPELSDPDVLAALQALAETYKTLATGIYYEMPPDSPTPRALYGELSRFLDEAKGLEAERSGLPRIKDSEVLALLVFLYRLGVLRSNGRPRSRRFIEFLRGQFPDAPELRPQESRIIVP
jgi:hypothetical protein